MVVVKRYKPLFSLLHSYKNTPPVCLASSSCFFIFYQLISPDNLLLEQHKCQNLVWICSFLCFQFISLTLSSTFFAAPLLSDPSDFSPKGNLADCFLSFLLFQFLFVNNEILFVDFFDLIWNG
jgi:hypothetical protein